MTSVLITRPLPSSETLLKSLQNLGYQTVIEPLLTIVPTHEARPAVENLKGLMITSSNAIDILGPRKNEVQDLLAYPCFTVGPKTASKAKEFGFQDTYFRDQDGAALARMIDRSFPDKGTILHITARDVASGAHDTLLEKGFSVTSWPIYSANSATLFSKETQQKFKEDQLDAILVYSIRTAEALKALVLKYELETCCNRLVAIGLSKPITEALKSLSWRKLVAADVPQEDAVIELLKKHCPLLTPN